MDTLSTFFKRRARDAKWKEELKPSDPLLKDPQDDDLIIVVLGQTGFINKRFGKDAMEVGNSLFSHTRNIAWVTINLGEDDEVYPGKRIVLVDTPGFNDGEFSDLEILRRISVWLAAVYDDKKTVTGLIYVSSLNENRFGASNRVNYEMLQELCGVKALGNVVMATTHWAAIPLETANYREKQLKEHFWEDVLENGAHVARAETPKDAKDITRHILRRAKEIEGTALQIQKELVDLDKRIPATKAGQKLRLTMQELAEIQKSQHYGSNAEAQQKAKEKAAYIESELKLLHPTGFERLKDWFGA